MRIRFEGLYLIPKTPLNATPLKHHKPCESAVRLLRLRLHVRNGAGRPELGDWLMLRLSLEISRLIAVVDAGRDVRNARLLVDGLVLAAHALALRRSSSAFAAEAHARRAAIVDEVGRRWDVGRPLGVEVAGALAVGISEVRL